MIASSFIRAIFRSRWVFSMTLAASATLMLEAGINAGSDHAAIHLSDSLQRFRGVTGNHLDDFRQRPLLVARIDPLGRITDEEVLFPLHSGVLLDDRDADFLGCAGIDRRLENHRCTTLEVPADRFR
jgi:hypothetical protein